MVQNQATWCGIHLSLGCCLWLPLVTVIGLLISVPEYNKIGMNFNISSSVNDAANSSLGHIPGIGKPKKINSEPQLTSKDTCSNLVGNVSVHLNGRLGNHIFQYASLFGIAHATCRQLVLKLTSKSLLRQVFLHLNTTFTTVHKALTVHEIGFGKYTPELVESLPRAPNILVKGYLQSFKYFARYENALRAKLKLKPELEQYTKDFLHKVLLKILEQRNVSHGDIASVIFVGVHQRRGDMLSRGAQLKGYMTADNVYFYRAMDHFRNKYTNVHFIVVGDDSNWIKTNIQGPDVTYSGQSSKKDFAILTKCNHSVMSVGTFGWWAAWLAGGDVIYFKDAFRPDSLLRSHVNLFDYYPSHWQAM